METPTVQIVGRVAFVAARRVIRFEGWRITQVLQPDGTWWNIELVREVGS